MNNNKYVQTKFYCYILLIAHVYDAMIGNLPDLLIYSIDKL